MTETASKPAIALGSDHAGFELKEELKAELLVQGHTVLDLGAFGPDSVDYPDFGHAVAKAIEDGRAEKGIVVCGTGIGISIAANRNPAVRAALCHSGLEARLAREHNDANVLALGARIIGSEAAKDALSAFLNTEFGGGRHEGRVAKLAAAS
ncbi:MAG: ribose 5-phosphate isomerase B [Alphaproteobacteria bacterium]